MALHCPKPTYNCALWQFNFQNSAKLKISKITLFNKMVHYERFTFFQKRWKPAQNEEKVQQRWTFERLHPIFGKKWQNRGRSSTRPHLPLPSRGKSPSSKALPFGGCAIATTHSTASPTLVPTAHGLLPNQSDAMASRLYIWNFFVDFFKFFHTKVLLF